MREEDVAQATQNAQSQRQRLRAQIDTTRDRLKPARLVEDAKGFAGEQARHLQQDAINHVRTHPVSTGFSALAVVAWMARKPLLARAPAAIKRTYYWLAGSRGTD